MKTYLHKLYDIQGNYKRTLSPNVVFSSILLDSSINSGVATYSLTIDTDYDDPIDITEYVLILEEYSELNKEGHIIFTGTIDDIAGIRGSNQNNITYYFGGLHRLLSDIYYSRTNYQDEKLNEMVQEVVDHFNSNQQRSSTTLGGQILKNGVTDETLITRDTSTFDLTCLAQLQDMFFRSGGGFYIKPDGTIVGGSKPLSATHIFTVGVDVVDIQAGRLDLKDIKNSILVKGPYSLNEYNDNTSIGLYGKKQKIVNLDSDYVPYQSDFAQRFLQENAYGQREIKIEILRDNYDNIYPGDTVKILNTRLDNVDNLRIQKMQYDGYKLILYLEKYKSLPVLLKNL